MNHADLNFIGRKFGQSVNQSFLRALNVGLDNQGQGLLAFRILTKKPAEFVIDLASQLNVTVLALTVVGQFTSLTLFGNDDEFVTGLRNVGEALNFHRDGRTGALNRLAVFVNHGANATESGAGQDDITAL